MFDNVITDHIPRLLHHTPPISSLLQSLCSTHSMTRRMYNLPNLIVLVENPDLVLFAMDIVYQRLLTTVYFDTVIQTINGKFF